MVSCSVIPYNHHNICITVAINICYIHVRKIRIRDCNLRITPKIYSLITISPQYSEVSRSYERFTNKPNILLVINEIVYPISIDICYFNTGPISCIYETCATRVIIRNKYILPICKTTKAIIVQYCNEKSHGTGRCNIIISIAVKIPYGNIGRITLHRILSNMGRRDRWNHRYKQGTKEQTDK